MVIRSDAQRRAMFAKRRWDNPTNPAMMKNRVMLTTTQKTFLAMKIRKNIKEGKPAKQAVAIAFNQARTKFPGVGIPAMKNQKTNTLGKKTVRLIVGLLGISVALSILRGIPKK